MMHQCIDLNVCERERELGFCVPNFAVRGHLLPIDFSHGQGREREGSKQERRER